jgi:hypothetical protein
MTLRLIAATVVLSLLAGCKTMDFQPFKASSDAPAKETPRSDARVPERLAAIWADALYTQVGQPAIRGFGGRLYFYDAQNEAMPVAGQLVVYAYEDSLDGKPSQMPSRKFVFTPEQFAQHYSPTELGASYSIWLPWDPVGGEKKSVSLVPVFTADGGKILTGQQSINILPGHSPEVKPQPRTGVFTELGASDPRLSPSRGSSPPAVTLPPGVPAGPSGVDTPTDTPPPTGSRDGWEQMHSFVPKAPQRGTMRTTTIQLPMSTTRQLVENAAAEKLGVLSNAGAEAEATTASAEEPSSPPPPATRSVPQRLRALRAAASQAAADRGPTPPTPSAPPSAPPPPQPPSPSPSPAGY